MGKGLSEDELKALIDGELRQSVGYFGGRLANSRQKALQYFEALPVGDLAPPEVEGRSRVVVPVVRTITLSVLASLMEKFASGENIVECEARRPEDEESAKIATEYLNNLFIKQNQGHRVLETAILDSLISKTGTVKVWWEPLMAMAPTVCDAVGAVCLFEAGDLPIAIDFPNRRVRRWEGEPYSFRFRVQRELVETVVAQRANDWSNALFLSCRFSAWRAGPFNEYVYNFFKSLSVERMRRTEAEALRKLDPQRGGIAEQDIRIGAWMVQRTCPHRDADLSVFGELDGDELVCTLHGWRFDLQTGACRNADDRPLRVRRANP